MARRVPLCPGCKTPVIEINRLVWFFSGLAVSGCLSFFVVGLFLLPFTPLLLLMPTVYRCKQCGHSWNKKEITDYLEK